MNRFSCHNAGRFLFNKSVLSRFNITFAVNRLTQRVDNTTYNIVSDRYFQKASKSFDTASLFDIGTLTEYNDTDNRLFEVQRHTAITGFKLNHFTRHNVVQSLNPCNTVGKLDYLTRLFNIHIQFKIFDSFLNQCTDFISFYFCTH